MESTAIVVSTAVLVLTASAAHAVVLCAKPRSDGTYNTSVKIREVCRSGETQLDAAQLGVQGEQGPQDLPGLPGNGVVVTNANGSPVGTVIDFPSGGVRVARREGLDLLTYVVRGDGSQSNGEINALGYSTTDCSGPAVNGPGQIPNRDDLYTTLDVRTVSGVDRAWYLRLPMSMTPTASRFWFGNDAS